MTSQCSIAFLFVGGRTSVPRFAARTPHLTHALDAFRQESRVFLMTTVCSPHNQSIVTILTSWPMSYQTIARCSSSRNREFSNGRGGRSAGRAFHQHRTSYTEQSEASRCLQCHLYPDQQSVQMTSISPQSCLPLCGAPRHTSSQPGASSDSKLSN